MRELQGWVAYYELEPSLDQRIDWLIASVVQMVHNAATGKKGQKPIKDFVLKFEQQERSKASWQDQKARMMMIVSAQNAFVESGQREA